MLFHNKMKGLPIQGAIERHIIKLNSQQATHAEDILAVEEPLQIELQIHTATGRLNKNIAVTMRTPGHDKELAAGFLFTEGIINNHLQIQNIAHAGNDENRVQVVLNEGVLPALQNAERNFYTTSSCGVCSKASIDAIKTVAAFKSGNNIANVDAAIFYGLQNDLQEQQELFASTGGLHAAALFNTNGNFIMLREDVGRHNALDKLIGHALLKDTLPLSSNILLLSGRASFELIQKAAMAGIPIVAAVGAPSSLAVELAEENNITLIGFLRQQKFNIYSGAQRIKL